MGKYSHCTVLEACQMELKELETICAKYHMFDEDIKVLRGMVIAPYFQLNKAFSSGRAMERLYIADSGTMEPDAFLKYLELAEEEERKFPFVLDGWEDVE